MSGASTNFVLVLLTKRDDITVMVVTCLNEEWGDTDRYQDFMCFTFLRFSNYQDDYLVRFANNNGGDRVRLYFKERRKSMNNSKGANFIFGDSVSYLNATRLSIF